MSYVLEIPLNPSNPGEVFGCSGILELTNILYGEALGYYSDSGYKFILTTSKDPSDFISKIANCNISGTENDNKINIGAPFDLLLDWWSEPVSDGRKLKTWSARQTSIKTLTNIQNELKEEQWIKLSPELWFEEYCKIVGRPFYFDAAIGSLSLSVDVGYSRDDVGSKFIIRPLVEFFSFVGIQRFRPFCRKNSSILEYWTWTVPLPPSIASIAFCGRLKESITKDSYYKFEMLQREQGYRAFKYSKKK